MAQVLSGLLDCVGLPQDQTIKSLNKSFNLFWENQLDDLTFRQELKNQNRCKLSTFMYNHDFRNSR